MLLRLSGLAQASGTPMRMLAIARTTLKNKRASRSQLSQVCLTFAESQKASSAAEAHRFLKNQGSLFGSVWLFFFKRQFGLVKHNGFGTFIFLYFSQFSFLICLELSKNVLVRSFALLAPAGHF